MSKRISTKATSDNIQRALAMLKSVPDHLENIGQQSPRAALDPRLTRARGMAIHESEHLADIVNKLHL